MLNPCFKPNWLMEAQKQSCPQAFKSHSLLCNLLSTTVSNIFHELTIWDQRGRSRMYMQWQPWPRKFSLYTIFLKHLESCFSYLFGNQPLKLLQNIPLFILLKKQLTFGGSGISTSIHSHLYHIYLLQMINGSLQRKMRQTKIKFQINKRKHCNAT